MPTLLICETRPSFNSLLINFFNNRKSDAVVSILKREYVAEKLRYRNLDEQDMAWSTPNLEPFKECYGNGSKNGSNSDENISSEKCEFVSLLSLSSKDNKCRPGTNNLGMLDIIDDYLMYVFSD